MKLASLNENINKLTIDLSNASKHNQKCKMKYK